MHIPKTIINKLIAFFPKHHYQEIVKQAKASTAILILRFHDIKITPRADLIIREQQLATLGKNTPVVASRRIRN